MWDAPYLSCLALYIFSFQIIVINSRTSTIWKLNEDGKIVDGTLQVKRTTAKKILFLIIDICLGTSLMSWTYFLSKAFYFLQNDYDKKRITEDDAIFNIITSTVYYGNTWTKHGFDMFCTDCQTYEQHRWQHLIM